MKNVRLRLSAAFLALIMCFGLLVGCGDSGITLKDVEKDPYAAIMTGSEKYTDALVAKYGDVLAVFDKIAKGTGTYKIDVSVPDSADISLTAVTDSKSGAYSAKATAGAMGFTTDISLWGDKNNIALSAPAIIGEGAYGVKLDTLEADLANSDLLASLTGMTFEDLKAALETEAGIKWDDLKGALSVDGWKTAFNKYMADVETLMKGKTYTVAEESFKIGETEVPVISVQYTLTKGDSEKITELAFDMVESMFGKVLTAAGVSLDDIIAETNAEELAGGVTTKCYLNKKTGAVIAEDVAYGEDVKATVTYGEDVSEKFEMSADVTATVDGETMDIDMTVKEITEEGKGGFDVDVTVKADEEEHTVAIDIVRNDADGKFEAKLSVDGAEMGSMAGTLTYNADELKLAVDSVTADGETTEIGLTLSAKAGGTVEALPEYTNIVTASAEELESLMTFIVSMITPSYDDMYGDLEDIYGEVEIPDESLTIEDLYGDMTDEEIEQFHNDLEDLGMTTDDIMNMLYQ